MVLNVRYFPLTAGSFFPGSDDLFRSTALSGSTCLFLSFWYAYYHCSFLGNIPTMSVKTRNLMETSPYSYSSSPHYFYFFPLLSFLRFLPLSLFPFPFFPFPFFTFSFFSFLFFSFSFFTLFLSPCMKNKEDAVVMYFSLTFTLRSLPVVNIQF